MQARPTRRSASAHEALSLRELARVPLVIPSRPNAIRMQVESALAAQRLRPTIAMEVDGVAAILELVAGGGVSAILSANAVQTSGRPRAFSMRPIGSPPLRSRLSMAVSTQRPTTLTQKSTQDLIRATVASVLEG